MKKITLFVAVIALISTLTVIPLYAVQYTGNLSAPVGLGVDGSGAWVTSTNPFSIEWLVKEAGVVDNAILWDYTYTLKAPTGALSHFILELSPNFAITDMIGLTLNGYTLDLYNEELIEFGKFGPHPGNPNIPGFIEYGIKIGTPNILSPTTAIYNFQSTRSPVWGDFYAKNGNAGGQGVNTAWNEGILINNPLTPPSDGSELFHILRPDTVMTPATPADTVVPEAGTMMLASFGMLSVLGFKLRKRS